MKKSKTMDKALQFLAGHPNVALATVEDGRPKVRTFQIMKTDDRRLYFATSATKAIYRQLRRDPHVEILTWDDNISVRITGRADFDVPESLKAEIYDSSPILRRLYRSHSDMEYFFVDILNCDYYDLRPTPPVLEHYEAAQGQTE